MNADSKETKTKQYTIPSVSNLREQLIALLDKIDLEYIQQQGCTDILADKILNAMKGDKL